MATNTTNFNLKKPAYTDTADIMDINGNMDKVESALSGLSEGLAIVSKNNTHAAITKGQYVYVHGHGSLTEGLYIANNNISANATLNTTNLSSVSGGLGSQVATLTRNDNAQSIRITSSDTTWEAIYAKLSDTIQAVPFTIYVSALSISAFTDGLVSTGYWYGVGMKIAEDQMDFCLYRTDAKAEPMKVDITYPSSSSPGTVVIARIKNEYTVMSGSVSDNTSIPAGTYVDIQVSFGKTLVSIPNVVASNSGSSATQSMENGKLTCTVISKSTSGFTVRVFNNSSITRTGAFDWVAIC